MLIGQCLLDARTALIPAKCVQTRAGIAFVDFTVVDIRAAFGDRVDDSATSPTELGRSSAGQDGDVAERIGNNGLEGLSGDGDVIDLLTVDQKVVDSREGSVYLNCLTVGERGVGDNRR